MGKQSLFDEDDDHHKVQAGFGGAGETLKVNQHFAQRFEHNKKREELHRLKEKYPEVAARMEAKELARQRTVANGGKAPEDEEDESSSDDDDNAIGLIPEKTELQILETLAKIRARDQSIYQPDTKFYSSESEGGEGSDDDEDGGKGKSKPVYLKDVVYQQALRDAAGEGTSSDEDDDNEPSGKNKQRGSNVKTYDDEQKELKNAFLQAFDEEAKPEGDDFGGVLKKKKRHAAAAAQERDDDSDDDNDDDSDDQGPTEGKIQEVLDSYFGKPDELPEDEKFLRDYILKKKWADEDGDYTGTGHSDDNEAGLDVDVEYDEQYLKAADQFEANYNFRYEEPGGGQLITYPRSLEGTVRKEDDRRKRKRAEKAARLAEDEEKRASEVRRLKTLKRKEIEERLDEVRQVAGAAAPSSDLLASLVDGEFDPDAHDKVMAAAFGEDYYQDGDDEDIADEEFEKELAAMAEYDDDADDDDDQGGADKEGTFAAMRRRLAEAEAAEGEVGEDEKALFKKVQGEIKRLMEEYHKLDYEDHVGGVPTRFRYKEVPKADYGLSPEDILMLDDRDLNQIVGLKRVAAPYRDDEGMVRPNYGKLNELRAAKGLQGGSTWGNGSGFSHHRQPRQYNNNNNRFNDRDGHHQHHHDGDGVGEAPAAYVPPTAAERRLASYAKPTLKRGPPQGEGQQQGGDQPKKKGKKSSGGHEGGEKQSEQQQQQQLQVNGVTLTKAQKKNLARAKKRAAKREIGE